MNIDFLIPTESFYGLRPEDLVRIRFEMIEGYSPFPLMVTEPLVLTKYVSQMFDDISLAVFNPVLFVTKLLVGMLHVNGHSKTRSLVDGLKNADVTYRSVIINTNFKTWC